MGKRILGQSQTQTDIPSTAPSGDVGIDMTLFQEASRPRWWLITVVITSAASDLYVWGAMPDGDADNITDDVWGLHQDEYKTFPLGKIGTAIPTGTYHMITDGLGLYTRVYFQKSAGTVNVTLSEILDAARGN